LFSRVTLFPSSMNICTVTALLCCLPGLAAAQTPTLDSLKEALTLERKPDLPAAQVIYQSLVADPDWGAAARLSLARLQRWQYQHKDAEANYLLVLLHPQATAGMKDEANIGLAHIYKADMRLREAQLQLAAVPPQSAIYAQVEKLREEVAATTPTRIGGSFGQTRGTGGTNDASWQLKLTHQIDMKNVVSVGYAANSLQQRSTQPDAALDFVKGQLQASWRRQVPLGSAYGLEVVHRQLNLGSNETSVRAQGSWPLSKDVRLSAAVQHVDAAASKTWNGSLGVSTRLTPHLALGTTLFAAESNPSTLYSWMVNTTWEQGPWLGQWFVSRSLDDSPVANTLILRQRLQSGHAWRAQFKRDRNGNSSFFGLDIPWGKQWVSTAWTTYPGVRQWTAGFDAGLPNGVSPAATASP
jgi:hypothetical protein